MQQKINNCFTQVIDFGSRMTLVSCYQFLQTLWVCIDGKAILPSKLKLIASILLPYNNLVPEFLS